MFSPLSLATGRGSTEVYVTQNFAGRLDRITDEDELRNVYRARQSGTEIGAVSRDRGTLYFMEGTGAGEHDPAPNVQLVKSRDRDGEVETLADVAQYEQKHNPDGDTTYGFRHVDEMSCLDQVKLTMGRAAKYEGAVDSHAYATAPDGGDLYVADAGGNDILRIDMDSGRVRTVAVLPAVALKITGRIQKLLKLPACVLGERFYLEPVPTDVEVGDDGWLYVSLLPAGAEDTSLGELGRVYKIDPDSGWTEEVARGLAGPTGLAVSDDDDIFVAEMFGNRISVIEDGDNDARTFMEAKVPGAVEIEDEVLYATVHAAPESPPAGQVLKVRLD
ncbi:hypothetical protein D477_005981 [Arthrobacter crystallopoietes BAB-32]|uniref:ScyD/ScyE family protein n=1 Tax=Arthrobacter crystallopoietes BAB-32 TaxID=1246476 RepID=N1VA62_9MICC|nr:ScyD/ScyE family protein [Arthrobacter crystallopoietes]EMY35178.1 hypothetical protein D477_005981 [Arthrobacter crystallopoietes BAB-32]